MVWITFPVLNSLEHGIFIYHSSVCFSTEEEEESVTDRKTERWRVVVLLPRGERVTAQSIQFATSVLSLPWWCLSAGLCGNFNSNQADDFLKLSGVPDATAAGFVNSWKTRAGCLDVKSNFENPCSLSLDNGRSDSFWLILIWLWVLQNHWCWSLFVNDREVCQALVLHAEWPSGSVCLLSLRDQPRFLQRGKSHSYCTAVSGPVTWPHTPLLFFYCLITELHVWQL